MDVHRRGDPGTLRLHHRQKLGRDELVPIFLLGELVEIERHAGVIPLGDLGALQLHGGRRVAGNNVGAKLGQRIGGMAGDGGRLPFAACCREHLAELGDRRRVGTVVPLRKQVRLGFGVYRSGRQQLERQRNNGHRGGGVTCQIH